MRGAILVLNAGSSSLKFGLYGPGEGEPQRLARGRIEDLQGSPRFEAFGRDGEALAKDTLKGGQGDPYEGALDRLLAFLAERFPQAPIGAAGHRIVHGGRDFAEPVRLDGGILGKLDALSPLAPLHQPHNLAPVRVLMDRKPELPQVGCFDTAFHRTNGRLAQLFALPRALIDEGVLRYGFHGLSYAYIAGRLAELDPERAGGRAIVAHLGNGASLCAMAGGKSVATTMGFTALEGLPMGTRSGSLDPGVLLYLLSRGYDARRLEKLLYEESGLLGLSGVSRDMRTLVESSDPHAKEAVGYFCYRVAREIGSLAAALGGLDTLVFTAGIGENAAGVREEICVRSAWLGLSVDVTANSRSAPRISAPASRVAVHVIPTNEELVIARETARLVAA